MNGTTNIPETKFCLARRGNNVLQTSREIDNTKQMIFVPEELKPDVLTRYTLSRTISSGSLTVQKGSATQQIERIVPMTTTTKETTSIPDIVV